jgi:hypothetical protein
MPNKHNIVDTIKFDGNYIKNSFKLSYYSSSTSPTGSETTRTNYGLHTDKFLYIVFRNQTGGKKKLGWLKLKINSSGSIQINSCYFVVNKDILIIE